MTWHYRVMKRTYNKNQTEFAIYEVYYKEDGTIEAWSEDPIYIAGEDEEELKKDLEFYCKALRRPVLDYDELEKNERK